MIVPNIFFLQFERQKMEREHKKKQEALTLEETKQQIQNFETKLTQLKEEKHQLFNTLKKVGFLNINRLVNTFY